MESSQKVMRLFLLCNHPHLSCQVAAAFANLFEAIYHIALIFSSLATVAFARMFLD